MDQNLIATPRDAGRSPLMVVQGRLGFFDWNDKPRFDPNIGKGKSPMYTFVEVNNAGEPAGTWGLRLEKDKQGGRWEGAHHARSDYEIMKTSLDYVKKHWPLETPQGKALKQAVDKGMTFEQMQNLVAPLDTWRQISGD